MQKYAYEKFTHSVVLVMYDVPLFDDFAFVVVAAVVQLHIAVAPRLVHNHFSFSRCKSKYDCQ